MSALIPYDFESLAVRAIDRDGAIWFVASDIARALGYRDAEKMTRNLDDDEQGTHNMGMLEGYRHVQRPVTIINESGLYAAILRSRRAEAVRFRKWVTSEVLPSIRKTGGYNAQVMLDPASIKASLAIVDTVRRTFGKNQAQLTYARLGLPLGEVAQAVLPPQREIDPLFEPIRLILEGKHEVTLREVLDAMAVPYQGSGFKIRRHIGMILREMGWYPRNERRSNGKVIAITQVFRPIRGSAAHG